jgi:uncharacterized membrane protein
MVVLAVDPYLIDWLDLAFRFLHVIAAIVWIGTSFYFVALDNHLRPPKEERDGVGGESWEIHGGGFYRIEKYRVTPPTIPEPLHWYKWEAYTTWLSGFALFIAFFYLQPRVYLVNALSPGWSIAASVGGLALAWVVYDALCRTVARRSEAVLALCVLAGATAAAYGSTQLFAPRAAFVQVGAMLGTIMAANVFFVIIPAHWELIRAKEAGREPSPAAGARGKQRSVHNNYLTLPVLFAMLANHFAFVESHAHAWLALVAFMVVGAAVRHFFNLRHQGRNVWAIPVLSAAVLVGIAFWLRPPSTHATTSGPVPFARAAAIVAQRCTPCHSLHPTQPGFTAPPAGVVFDSPRAIRARAQAIKEQAVVLKAMPLGNVTHMSDAERAELGAWIDQGAKIP